MGAVMGEHSLFHFFSNIHLWNGKNEYLSQKGHLWQSGFHETKSNSISWL